MVRVLERLAAERGVPDEIVLDNGPELTGKALDQWAYERGVRLHFIEPGKPIQNAFARASTDGCATNASTSTGSSASPMPGTSSRRGGWTTITERPHSALGYRRRQEFATGLRSSRGHRGRNGSDSHNAWTKQRGQVSTSHQRFSGTRREHSTPCSESWKCGNSRVLRGRSWSKQMSGGGSRAPPLAFRNNP